VLAHVPVMVELQSRRCHPESWHRAGEDLLRMYGLTAKSRGCKKTEGLSENQVAVDGCEQETAFASCHRPASRAKNGWSSPLRL